MNRIRAWPPLLFTARILFQLRSNDDRDPWTINRYPIRYFPFLSFRSIISSFSFFLSVHVRSLQRLLKGDSEGKKIQFTFRS